MVTTAAWPLCPLPRLLSAHYVQRLWEHFAFMILKNPQNNPTWKALIVQRRGTQPAQGPLTCGFQSSQSSLTGVLTR